MAVLFLVLKNLAVFQSWTLVQYSWYMRQLRFVQIGKSTWTQNSSYFGFLFVFKLNVMTYWEKLHWSVCKEKTYLGIFSFVMGGEESQWCQLQCTDIQVTCMQADLCLYVCMCVCERERERGGGGRLGWKCTEHNSWRISCKICYGQNLSLVQHTV